MASAHCLLKSLHFRASQLGHRASEDPAWPASSYACLLPCTCLLLPATLGFVAGRQSSSDEIDDDAIHACIMGWDDGCVHLGAHAPCVPCERGRANPVVGILSPRTAYVHAGHGVALARQSPWKRARMRSGRSHQRHQSIIHS